MLIQKLVLVRLGVLSLCCTLVTYVFSQNIPDDGDIEELDPYIMTGSRLPELSAKEFSPVHKVSVELLEAQGHASVAEYFLSSTMSNGQNYSPNYSGITGHPGFSGLNMRGLGHNSTLVLINGRRAAAFPFADGFNNQVDLNSFPMGAVGEIEMLKDGASAIYGSDAVAGVINVKLRKDFEGGRARVTYGNSTETGFADYRADLLQAGRIGKFHYLLSLDTRKRESIDTRDLEYTATADHRPWGSDGRSTGSWPANVVVPSLGQRLTFPEPTTNPTVEGAVVADFEAYGRYDFNEATNLIPRQDGYGAFLYGTYELSETTDLYTELSYNHFRVVPETAPAPMFNSQENGDDPSTGIVIPAHNPYNPWNEDLNAFFGNRLRIVEAGNRVVEVITKTPRLLLGARGELGDTWKWDTGWMYNESYGTQNHRNSVIDQRLQDAFNGINVDGEMLYMNPFGANDPRLIDSIKQTVPFHGLYEIASGDVTLNGVLAEIKGIPIYAAFGYEHREEFYRHRADPIAAAGQVIGGLNHNTLSGNRSADAAYAEFFVPVHKYLDLQLAVRHERYSDFGNTTKPKLAVSVNLMDSLSLRASYSEAFQAPALSYLYTSKALGVTNSVLDPKRPDEPRLDILTEIGGNPDLQPEETEVKFVGLKWDGSKRDGWLERLSFSLDYFVFNQSNLISSYSAGTIINNEDDPEFGKLIDRAPADGIGEAGPILLVRTNVQNISKNDYEGYDLQLRYDWETDRFGDFGALVDFTFKQYQNRDGRRISIGSSRTRWRSNLTLFWKKDDWTASVFLRYLHKRDFIREDLDQVKQEGINYFPAYYTFNTQLSYKGFENYEISVGVRNLLNMEPPRSDSENVGYALWITQADPRSWYVRVTRNW